MKGNPQRVVFGGYDKVADAYLGRFGASAVRQRWFERLVAGLPPSGGRVLDLGCGAGVPVARDLTELGHTVIGVDGSSQQIARARRNVPSAEFIEADMCSVAFAAGSLDGVGAFYAITHVPPTQQDGLIRNIATWLKPGGTFVASFGTGAAGEWTGEWLGIRMFFGHAGEAETMRSLARAEFSVRLREVEEQDNEDAKFMWVEAVKGR
jgi:SAM-dependent methyltransferase